MNDRHRDTRSGEGRTLEAALHAIPIFPLPEVVLFPEAVLPLHVFEPRYRAMLADCLTTHGALVVAQLVDGEDPHGRPRIAPIAGGGIIVEHQAMPDGRANIVLLGRARLRLEELAPDPSRPYRAARATILEDLPSSLPRHEHTTLVAVAAMFAAEVRKHDPHFTFELPNTLDGGRVADLCAFHLVVDAVARQAILDELDPRARAAMVLRQITTQHAAMVRADGNRVLN